MGDAPVKKTAKACGSCRRRKVKCNGAEPCQQCSHHGLQCAYSQSSHASRVSAVRGRVMNDCRPSDQHPVRKLLAAGPSSSHGTWNEHFFHSLVDSYMESVYPTHPIIAKGELLQCIDSMDLDNAAAAFVYASAAATLHCAAAVQITVEDREAVFRGLLENAIELMGFLMPSTAVSTLRATTCFMLANCLVALEDSNTAFLYLRQGVTMIEILGTKPHMASDPRLGRLYWLAYVHERYQCFAEYRVPVLRPRPDITLEDDDIAPEIISGLVRVVKLFQLIDDTFIRCWLNSNEQEAPFDAGWIEAKCNAFEQDEREVELAGLPIAQQADLFVTRHWLLALLWRICMARGLLRDLSPEKCFSMLFPLHVSKRLREVMEKIPMEAFQIHGVGIVQKLFELTDTVADVMLYVPSAAAEQLDDLLYLQKILFGFPHLDAVRRRIVTDKSNRILNNAGLSVERISTP